MNGYCEWCGRQPSLREQMRGDGIALSGDGTLYLCPECRQGAAPLTNVPPRPQRAISSFKTIASVFGATTTAVVAFALLFNSTPATAPHTGEVQGITQLGPGPTADPTPRGSIDPRTGSSPATDDGQNLAQKDPAVAVGQAVIRTWTDTFGRSRLQLIVPVRNNDARWVLFPRGTSTYRIMDGSRSVASGTFTALAAVTKPGGTAYLVDTISVAAGDLTPDLSAEWDVDVLPTIPPAVTLSVRSLQLTDGIGGVLRATGLVHNDGGEATRSVIAGVIALDRDGMPVAAVFDTTDVGRVEPGQARRFTTDANRGGPPVPVADISEVVGVAFEADPDR